MTNVDLLYQLIDRGREGKNIGLNTGSPKIDSYTGGIQRGNYTLIFGLSGSGILYKNNLDFWKFICIFVHNKII